LDKQEEILKIEGVFSVLPTLLTTAGDVDFDGLRRVVDLYVKAGVNGVTALGVTGEAARLNERGRGIVLDTVVGRVNGRIPVVAGTTADGLRTCIEYSRNAQTAGASALMVSPPRMPKLNSDAVLAHFSALSSAVGVEIVIQDYPPISGFSMEPLLLARIAREVPRARTIRLEDPPTRLRPVEFWPNATDRGQCLRWSRRRIFARRTIGRGVRCDDWICVPRNACGCGQLWKA
jgi:4-hydroxy-tetrahydrodipicolinate synthase